MERLELLERPPFIVPLATSPLIPVKREKFRPSHSRAIIRFDLSACPLRCQANLKDWLERFDGAALLNRLDGSEFGYLLIGVPKLTMNIVGNKESIDVKV